VLNNDDGRPHKRQLFRKVAAELVDESGGLTAHTRVPADGLWKDDDSSTDKDEIVINEGMAENLVEVWWNNYRRSLEKRFRQEHVSVRGLEAGCSEFHDLHLPFMQPHLSKSTQWHFARRASIGRGNKLKMPGLCGESDGGLYHASAPRTLFHLIGIILVRRQRAQEAPICSLRQTFTGFKVSLV
jgi:hypothetical protein